MTTGEHRLSAMARLTAGRRLRVAIGRHRHMTTGRH